MKSKLSRRILALTLAMIIVFSNLYLPGNIVSAATEGKWSDHTEKPSDGDGTDAKPYEVTKPEHLAWIAANGQKDTNIGSFKLMNDIDLSAYLWVPGKYFKGTLDGNGKTVKNMTVDNTTVVSVDGSDYAGLIAVLRPDAVIKNLTLDNVSISIERANAGTLNVGAVAGQSTNGTIDNCTVKGSIAVNRTSTTASDVTRVGGIVGYALAWGAKTVNITNSINRSSITADVDAGLLYVGGVSGHNGQGGTDSGNVRKVNLINTANLGTVTVSGASSGGYAGGLIGVIETVTVIRAGYNTGVITNSCTGTSGIGAISGKLSNQNVTVSDIYYLNTSSAGDGVGNAAVAKTDSEMVGADFVTTLNSAVQAANTALGEPIAKEWTAVTGGYPLLTVTESDDDDTPAISGMWSDHTEKPSVGEGTDAKPYEVTKPEHLAWIAANGKKSENIGSFKLMNDIDLSAHYWVPGTYFLGTLDGNGKTVKNMTVDNSTVVSVDGSDYAGLIAVLRPDAVIKNLTLDNVSISIERANAGTLNVGAVAGQSVNGTIDNCTVKGSIAVNRTSTTASDVTRVGGIVGYALAWGAKTVNITNSINRSAVAADVDAGILTVGGMIGYTGQGGTDSDNTRKVNLINSANIGSVTAAGAAAQGYAGGLVGWLQTVTVLKSGYNTGAVSNTCTATAGTGAIAGANNSTNLTVANIYYLDSSAEADGVGDKATAKTDTQMKSADFVTTMIQAAVDAQAAYGWEADSGSYPVISEGEPILGPETWLDHAASGFAGGDGKKETPYIITNAAQLALVAKSYGSSAASNGVYFEIQAGSTIDLAAYDWSPIAEFCGHFNGNGVQIQNMTIVAPCDISAVASGSQAAGMFGIVHAGATVKNVVLDVEITVESNSQFFVGGLVGQLRDAQVDHCQVSGSIDASMPNGAWNNFLVGGAVGRMYSTASNVTAVRNCISNVSITTERKDTNGNRCVGGIVGEAYAIADSTANMEIINCANLGTITVKGTKGTLYDVGGIIGYMWRNAQTTSKLSLKNCYNAGAIDASAVTDAAVGGVAGVIYATTYIENAYLYYLDSTASSVGSAVTGTSLSAEEMKDADFVSQLNSNARQIAPGVAYGWVLTADGYPTHGSEVIGAYVTWSVRGGSLGSVTVEIQESGSEQWSPIIQPQEIPEGCKIRFTFNLGTNGKIKSLTVNGEEVTPTENVYITNGNGSVSMAVTFVPLVEEAPENIYVDPDAENVTGYGTLEYPYKTLLEAKVKIAQLLEAKPYANIVVYLMGGTYTLEETLTLGAEQSSDGRVTFKNYNEETPIISGAQQIPTGSFTKVEGEEYYSYQLPESAMVSGSWPEFRTLLVNGQSATLARTEDLVFTKSYPNEVMSGYGIKSCDNMIFLDKDAMNGITDDNSGNLEIQMYIEWKVQVYHLENITENSTDVSATIRSSEWDEWCANDQTKRTLAGKTYFLQNHISFLDEAGEFYYDETTGTIYYFPFEGEDMTTADVEYATLDILVEMENASNITFDGITFTGTTANIMNNGYIGQLGAMVLAYAGDVDGVNVPVAAIRGDYATGITIQNCTFEELAGHGILMENGIEDLNISGNVIRNVGISGIIVGVNGQDITLPGASRDVNISNNYVTNVGTVIPSGIGISVARCVNLKILYNKVEYVPYTGIRVGWGFNVHSTDNENTNLKNAEIAYNHVENFLMKINDGGGIYTCGANGYTTDTELFNSVHDNYIKGNGNRGTCNGIYHDGSSSNFHTYNNVVVDVKQSLHPQDDVPSQNSHNLLVENNYTTHSAMSTSATADRNVVLQNNTHVADMDKLPQAALDIIAAAGLEAPYQSIEKPIDAHAVITNPTVHNRIPDEETTVQLELLITNNSSESKTYTVAMMDDLLANIKADYEGNGVTLNPGQSATVTVILSVIDPEAMEITTITAQGFTVTDQQGRVTAYPRAFSLEVTKSGSINEVAYGTPVIDGVMDDIYKESHRIPLGVVFYPNALATSDVNGYVYLVWDEDYLYCYVVVNDNSVVSRGLDFINRKDPNSIWASDTVETYLRTPLRKENTPQNTKFAIDAFGVMRYTNAESHLNTLEYHNSLPYATAFTYNGEIIAGYSIKEPTAGQNASTAEHPVNGYVIEMTLPIKEIASLQVAGQPQSGDQFSFKIQVDDYDGTVTSTGDAYVVALETDNISMTLVKSTGLTVSTATLLLKDEVQYKYYYDVSVPEGLTITEMGIASYVDSTFGGTPTYYPNATTDASGSVLSAGIPAKNLGDTQYVKVYAKLSDGSYLYSQEITYSAALYAKYQIENSQDEKLVNLCKALLHYGAAAQQHFGYNTDALMNDGIDAAPAYDASMLQAVVSGSATGYEATNSGFSYAEARVVLGGSLSINYYFTPSESTDAMTLYVFENGLDHDPTQVSMVKQADGSFKASVTGISARNMGQTVYVAVKYGAHCSGVISFSVMEAAKTYMTNADLKTLAEAMVVYGDCANKYFNQQG